MPNNNVSIESIAFAISEACEMLQELSVFADIDGKREFMDIQNKMKMGITLLQAQEPIEPAKQYAEDSEHIESKLICCGACKKPLAFAKECYRPN